MNKDTSVKLNSMIAKLCPDGVEYKELWTLTAWDKKFNGLEREKQKKVINYPYVLANRFKELERSTGSVRLLSTGNYIGWTSEELAGNNLCDGEIVAIPGGGHANVKYYKGKFVTADNRIATSLNTNVLLNKFLYYWMLANNELLESFYRGSGIKHPSMKSVLEIKIPLPPLVIQQEIVNILDKFTELEAELEARKKQYNYYRDRLLEFQREFWQWVEIQEMFEIKNGYTPSKANPKFWTGGTIPWFRMEDIRQNGRILSDSIQHITRDAVKGKLFPADSIIVATTATIGEHALIIVDSLANQQFTFLTKKVNRCKEASLKDLNMKFFYYYMFIVDEWCKEHTNISGFASVDMNAFKKLKIPLPPLSEQNRIVAILDKFDALTNDISAGLPAEISVRRKQYGYYRDKLLTFPASTRV